MNVQPSKWNRFIYWLKNVGPDFSVTEKFLLYILMLSSQQGEVIPLKWIPSNCIMQKYAYFLFVIHQFHYFTINVGIFCIIYLYLYKSSVMHTVSIFDANSWGRIIPRVCHWEHTLFLQGVCHWALQFDWYQGLTWWKRRFHP